VQKINIFIADDNTDFRDRVRAIIEKEKDFCIVGDVSDANHIIKEVKDSKADIVLLDVSMPGMNGLEAARALTDKISGLKIIMVSVYDIEEYKEAALASGAFGYLVKKDIVNKLIPIIREAVTGL